MKKETNYGINKLYSKDPIEADRLLWGRRTSALTRRGFLNNSALMAMAAALGTTIPYGDSCRPVSFPQHLPPIMPLIGSKARKD